MSDALASLDPFVVQRADDFQRHYDLHVMPSVYDKSCDECDRDLLFIGWSWDDIDGEGNVIESDRTDLRL